MNCTTCKDVWKNVRGTDKCLGCGRDAYAIARDAGLSICCAAEGSVDCVFGSDDPRCFYYEGAA